MLFAAKSALDMHRAKLKSHQTLFYTRGATERHSKNLLRKNHSSQGVTSVKTIQVRRKN